MSRAMSPPCAGQVRPDPPPLPPAPARTGERGQPPPPAPPAPRKAKPAPAPVTPLAPLERRLRQRLSRGTHPIDASIDLHGMRQAEAHDALRGFLTARRRRASGGARRHRQGRRRAGPRRPLRRARRAAPDRPALAAAAGPEASRGRLRGSRPAPWRRGRALCEDPAAASPGRSMTPFGERLRALRAERGLALKDMAEALGVTPPICRRSSTAAAGVPIGASSSASSSISTSSGTTPRISCGSRTCPTPASRWTRPGSRPPPPVGQPPGPVRGRPGRRGSGRDRRHPGPGAEALPARPRLTAAGPGVNTGRPSSSERRLMTAPLYDVLGLGNAIVDVLARTEDDFLIAHGLHKGAMRLIDEPGRSALRRHGTGHGDLRRLGGEHDRRASRPSAGAAALSAR